MYAATAARIWSESVAIVSRVGSNFPQDWLEHLHRLDFNVEAIQRVPEPHRAYSFFAYSSPEDRSESHPSAHFMKLGLSLPKEFLDYKQGDDLGEDRNQFGPLTLRPDDVPSELGLAKGVHLTPSEFLSHTTIPVRLRDLGVRLITLDASQQYMEPSHEDELRLVISGLNAFLVSKDRAQAYFRPERFDVWDMSSAFADMGCRWVVIKRGARGQCVFDRDTDRRWIVPAYPVQSREVTGAGDAYCGGFLCGLGSSGDVLEAALQGSVSASVAVEGVGAEYMLDTLPGLAQARLESLRGSVKAV